MMEVKHISYHYKGCPEVLKDVSFTVEPGKFLAILGNNGVGKSTLLKCFNHILKPDSGEVLLDGENLLTQSSREVAKQVAFVSQSVPNTQMTVHDVVMLGRRPYMKWGFTEEDHHIVHDVRTRIGVAHKAKILAIEHLTHDHLDVIARLAAHGRNIQAAKPQQLTVQHQAVRQAFIATVNDPLRIALIGVPPILLITFPLLRKDLQGCTVYGQLHRKCRCGYGRGHFFHVLQ